MNLHPQIDEHRKPVTIHHPHTPSHHLLGAGLTRMPEPEREYRLPTSPTYRTARCGCQLRLKTKPL